MLEKIKQDSSRDIYEVYLYNDLKYVFLKAVNNDIDLPVYVIKDDSYSLTAPYEKDVLDAIKFGTLIFSNNSDLDEE